MRRRPRWRVWSEKLSVNGMFEGRREKIAGVIQARMNSTRFPRKPLAVISGSAMVEYIRARLGASRYIDSLCVATTQTPPEDELVRFMSERGIADCRGAENDIVARLCTAAREFSADVLVRVWGDCPLVDAGVIDGMIRVFFERGADYATNSIPATFPFGLNAEVYSARLLERIHASTQDPFYREFPVEYIKAHSEIKMEKVVYHKDTSDIKLTVDYPGDLEAVARLIEEMSRAGQELTVDSMVRFCGLHGEIFESTRGLPRNIEYDRELRARGLKKDL